MASSKRIYFPSIAPSKIADMQLQPQQPTEPACAKLIEALPTSSVVLVAMLLGRSLYDLVNEVES